MVTELEEKEVSLPTIHVIREVYEGEFSHHKFEVELDKALDEKVNYIIIEPSKLGDETERWITVGNCLYKTAVVTGLASIASAISDYIWQQKPVIYSSLGAVSILCTGLYTISWDTDPCVKYQVEKNIEKSNLPNINNFSSPVVLVYKDNKKVKYTSLSVTFIATAFCAWRLYVAFK